jgi:hypothetical protein
VVVSAGTSALREQFSHRDHITAPFVVGRAPFRHEPPGAVAADLLLDAPYLLFEGLKQKTPIP